MARSNKRTYLLLSFAGTFLLSCALYSPAAYRLMKSRMLESIKITVYFSDDAETGRLRELEGLLFAHPALKVENFTSPEEALQRLASDPAVSGQVKLLEGSLALPASYTLSAATLDIETFIEAARGISSLSYVKEIDIPYEFALNTASLLRRIRVAGMLFSGLFLSAAFLMLYTSACLYIIGRSAEIRLAESMRPGSRYAFYSTFRHQFAGGLFGGALSAVAIHLMFIEVGAPAPGYLSAAAVCAACALAAAAVSVIPVSRRFNAQ